MLKHVPVRLIDIILEPESGRRTLVGIVRVRQKGTGLIDTMLVVSILRNCSLICKLLVQLATQ